MARGWKFWRRKPVLIRHLITSHMGGPCDDAETVAHTIKPIERVNLQLALDGWLRRDEAAGRLVGYSRDTFFSNIGIAQLLQDDVPQAPVQRQRVPASLDDELDCV